MSEIKTEDVYEDFNSDKHMFNSTTNYSTKSKYCDNKNKLRIGKMKDVLMNNKCLRHLINPVKSKDNRIKK